MMSNSRKRFLHSYTFASIALTGTLILVLDEELGTRNHARNWRRNLIALDPRSVQRKNFDDFLRESYTPEPVTKFYNLPNDEWCRPSQLPPLDYGSCNKNGLFNAVPLLGGLTNGLKFIVLSVIKSFEDNGNCFFIDETHSIFPKQFGPFLENYFEPIGLPATSEDVERAQKEHRVVPLEWKTVWVDLNKRRIENTNNNIPFLNYTNVEGHDLKRNMLRRVWRLQPKTRDSACSILQNHIHGDEFIALSIRQGDKTTEGFKFATMQQYVDKVEEIVPIHFDGRTPLIFAATDACEPLEEFKKLRPGWRIVSECDRVVQHGFVLQDHLKWTREQVDEHYSKFFVELLAMAGAKVWIGVAYSNVSWWVYFMRKKTEQKTFYVLDTEGAGAGAVPMAW